MSANYDDLKKEAYKMWESGTPFTRVYKIFGIPKNVVKTWFQEFDKTEQAPLNFEKAEQARKEVRSITVYPKEQQTVVKSSEVLADVSEDLSDFELARLTLRELCLLRGMQSGIAVQAATCLLKAVQMKVDLPDYILYGGKEESEEMTIDEFKQLTAEEKSMKLRELLHED